MHIKSPKVYEQLGGSTRNDSDAMFLVRMFPNFTEEKSALCMVFVKRGTLPSRYRIAWQVYTFPFFILFLLLAENTGVDPLVWSMESNSQNFRSPKSRGQFLKKTWCTWVLVDFVRIAWRSSWVGYYGLCLSASYITCEECEALCI